MHERLAALGAHALVGVLEGADEGGLQLGQEGAQRVARLGEQQVERVVELHARGHVEHVADDADQRTGDLQRVDAHVLRRRVLHEIAYGSASGKKDAQTSAAQSPFFSVGAILQRKQHTRLT